MASKMVTQEEAYLEKVYSSSTSPSVKASFLSWPDQLTEQISSQTESLANLLSSIPIHNGAGCLSLAALSLLLSQYQGSSTSTFDIIRTYNKIWRSLPEVVKAGHDEDATSLVQQTFSDMKSHLQHLPGLFISSSLPALIDPTTQKHITHHGLSSFIQNFRLPGVHDDKNSNVVAVALQNGHLLGLACLAVASYYTAAPINIAGGADQFRSDVELANPRKILVLESDVERLGLLDTWVSEANIQVIIIEQKLDLTFATRLLNQDTSVSSGQRPKANAPDDLALILFTSGTSGKKKVVPMTAFGLMTGVCCVIDSWGLTDDDSCVNMMPLNHVGGLIRNLFAPVLSGGSTILCPAFDPNLFWDILEEGQGSWYYASPSMHMSILAEGSLRPDSLSKCRLRLVCNAAGGLLPALAVRLRDTFKCTVLPSYGMTECMPISTPPLGYTLDRVGTSGIGCGPEIAILDESDNILPPGDVGRINVRGGPAFTGYLKGDTIDKSAFNRDGWFDTGDLGSLDADGYLYLTGRGKEVVNRGGELISPFEVEEAITIASQNIESPLYGRVQQVLAFSAPHEVLQEVVGVAIVTPSGQPRPDVRLIQSALKSSLHSPKWPVIVVYMDALPTSNNKIVRIKLGERLGLKSITDDIKLIERHFTAVCPPVNSLLSTKIPSAVCENDLQHVLSHTRKIIDARYEVHVGESHHDGTPEITLAPAAGEKSLNIYEKDKISVASRMEQALDGFLVPSSITYLETPFPRGPGGAIDEDLLRESLKLLKASHSSPAASETEQIIRRAFGEVLGFDENEITSESEFFDMGGDSLSAGRLLSIIRRDMQIRIPVDQLFGASRVCELRDLVDSILARNSAAAASSEGGSAPKTLHGCDKTYSSTNPLVLLINLTPIILFYPLKMGFQWTILMYSLATIGDHWAEPNVAARFLALVASMFISRASTQIVAPIIGIIFKWVVMGKYKEGMYPMWGPYHTRWWIVQKVLLICGKGIFRHLDVTRLFYYRLLGAKIGKGVTIEKGTTLGEYDLLEIGDNVHLDRCIVRPFAAERNTSMYLAKITIGSNSSIGLKSHVVAGSTLPVDTYIGANSSSYEMSDADDSQRSNMPVKTHFLLQIFAIIPLQVAILFISSLPWMAGLFGIVMTEPVGTVDSVKTVIIWWATPHRIGYHYLAQTLNVAVRPFVWFALVVVVKKVLDMTLGRATPKPAGERTQVDNFRAAILRAIVPNGNLHRVTKLFGTHYEFTSMAVRAMGGKVGKRVYWPGTGPSMQDFDLVDVGDDVVFGSRSHLITSDAISSDYIRIGNGAMIADRAVLSPGTTVGESAVLGSGAFIKRNQACARQSVWVGNRNGGAICLTGAVLNPAQELARKQPQLFGTGPNTPLPSYPGSPPATDFLSYPPSYCNTPRSMTFAEVKPLIQTSTIDKSATVEKDSSTSKSVFEKSYKSPSISSSEKSVSSPSSSPFGRAFYEGRAPYHVLGPYTIFFYSTFTTVFVQCFWNAGTISTLMLAAVIKRTEEFERTWYRPLKVYGMSTAFLSGIFTLLAMISLMIVICAKWAILGRRKVGNYDWDKSSYCQRWQLFLNIEAVRRRCFSGNGVLGMLTGTHFCVLYFRALGAKIGKDCALFAGGRPSLMFTEPDLLTLGDRVTTDDSSLVCHINSRGNFSLNRLNVGDRSVLRSGSRLLSGATMGNDVVLLEHTLIMAGDVADDGTCYQGWPADVFHGNRLRVGKKE
ncbi:peroxisomal-coenzyme a synthetase [Phlyctema vagabunda]|uniref:Peroxisomal-coenzyme a synthetase n=1 Tax=Phlyctema vagabunda TaxID=108571 RepID=A0ABR4P7L8_9HELO